MGRSEYMIDLGKRFPDRQVGSNGKPCVILFTGDDGAPVDLTTATITFRMVAMDADQTVKIASAAGSGDVNGVATYAPTLSDLDTSGDYQCQMIAAVSGGRIYRSELYSLRVLPNA